MPLSHLKMRKSLLTLLSLSLLTSLPVQSQSLNRAPQKSNEGSTVWPNGPLRIGPLQIPAPVSLPEPSPEEIKALTKLLESKVDLRKAADNKRQSFIWLLDLDGKEIKELDYLDVSPYSEGLASAFKVLSSGYIDTQGTMVIAPRFGSPQAFSEGLAWVHSQDKGNGYLNHEGQQIIANNDFFDGLPFSEGYAAIRARTKQSEKDDFRKSGTSLPGKWGFIDKQGHFTVAPYYDQVKSYHQKRAAVKLKGDWLFIDERGAQIGDLYQDAGSFAEDLAPIKMGPKWGYISVGGTLTIPCRFEEAASFANGLARVKMAGKYGFINNAGKLVVKPVFKDALDFSEYLSAVQADNGSWGYINTKGKFEIKPIYDAVQPFSQNRALVTVDKRQGFIDRSGNYVVEPKYDFASSYSDNRAIVSNKNWNHPITRSALLEIHLSNLNIHADADSQTGIYIPTNFDDALKELDLMLPQKAKEDIQQITQSEMNGYHFGFGMFLRNSWGLWHGSRLARSLNTVGLRHPDDMSATILKSYWCLLNKKPFSMTDEVKYFDKYWQVEK